ncbi:MAG: ATP-binding protein [Myxococcota bacterium]
MKTFGRREKLFELQKAWAVALSGRPRVALVEGPSGTGKSHLVDAFLSDIRERRSTERTPLVGRGICSERDGWSVPMRPFWEALGAALDDWGSRESTLDFEQYDLVGRIASVLPGAVTPELAPKLARVIAGRHLHARLPVDRLVEDTELLARNALLELAAEHPVCLVIDDVEVADDATFSLLRNLIRPLWEGETQTNLLIVLSYDVDEAGRRGQIQQIKADLDRHNRPDNRVAHTLDIKGLGRSAVNSLIESEARGAQLDDPIFSDWMTTYTEGNPRAVQELVRGLLSQGILEAVDGVIYVHDKLTQRENSWQLGKRLSYWLNSLGESEALKAARAGLTALDRVGVELLAIGSIVGPRFSTRTAVAVSGRDELEVTRALGDLTRRRYIREVRGVSESGRVDDILLEFTNVDYVAALRSMLTETETRVIHNRLANHLILERSKLRDAGDRLRQGVSPLSHSTISQKFRSDSEKVGQARRIVERGLARHLLGAGRAVEAAKYLYSAADILDQPPPDDPVRIGERARQVVRLAQRSEDLLLRFASPQLGEDAADIAQAEIRLAQIASAARAETGHFRRAITVIDRAIDQASWLQDSSAQLRAQSLRVELLYRCGRHREAREAFEGALSDFMTRSNPRQIIELLQIYGRWEHSDVAVTRLEQLAAEFAKLERADVEDAAYLVVLRNRARHLIEQWQRNEVGETALADTTRDASELGLAADWLDILVEAFQRRIVAQRISQASFFVEHRSSDDLAEAARDLLDDSSRLLELQRLTAETAESAGVPRQAARAKVAYAELIALWRDRADAILEAARSCDSISEAHRPAFDELHRQMGSGRLNQAEFARCLRQAIAAARSFDMTRHEAALRAQLIGNGAVDPEEAAAELEALEYLQKGVDHDLFELHLTLARVRRARVENRGQKSAVLAQRGLDEAAELYRRAPDADRWWIAGTAATLARIVGDADAERRWWRYQLETLSRGQDSEDFSVIDALELAAAADDLDTMRLPGRALSTARIGKLRRLVELAQEAKRDGTAGSSVKYLREAHDLLLDDPEWTPLAFEIEASLSEQLFELAGTSEHAEELLDDALSFWDKAKESAVLLGRCGLACKTLASLILEAHRHGLKQYWARYEELIAYTTKLEHLEVLDSTFDLSVELLRRAQTEPVLGHVEADRIEERIQNFILEHTPGLRELGADSMLRRWDITLSGLTDTTKPLSIPQHLRHT